MTRSTDPADCFDEAVPGTPNRGRVEPHGRTRADRPADGDRRRVAPAAFPHTAE